MSRSRFRFTLFGVRFPGAKLTHISSLFRRSLSGVTRDLPVQIGRNPTHGSSHACRRGETAAVPPSVLAAVPFASN
jgi:hypothetical protein